MKGADVFVLVFSKGNIVSKEMVQSMAKKAIINLHWQILIQEITYNEARDSREDIIST